MPKELDNKKLSEFIKNVPETRFEDISGDKTKETENGIKKIPFSFDIKKSNDTTSFIDEIKLHNPGALEEINKELGEHFTPLGLALEYHDLKRNKPEHINVVKIENFINKYAEKAEKGRGEPVVIDDQKTGEQPFINKIEKNSEYESQKAEVERRRNWSFAQEDLNRKGIYIGWYETGKEDKYSGTERIMVEGKSEEEVLKEINARYDAKLAELDKKFGKNTQPEETSVVESIEEKLEEIKNLEDNEDWNDEEKKILNNLLNQIEITKKMMDEIKIEQERRKKPKEVQTQDAENKPEKENREKQPFSFNVEFIKNKIEEIISSNKNIKKIEGLSIIPGPNNEFILNVNKIVAEFKFLFTFTTEITVKNARLINSNGGIKLEDGYEIKATDYEKRVKEKITENLDKINNEIIKIIEKEINKKVEKIWIENGELKAL